MGVDGRGRPERRGIRGTTRSLEEAARELRRGLTPAEQVLWDALRGRRAGGLRFRCQHPVGPFVLDFFCPAARLVIEVDGVVHEQQREQDAARTDHLQQYGYHVLRFTNDQVINDLNDVVERIVLEAQDIPPEQRARRRKPPPPAAPDPATP